MRNGLSKLIKNQWTIAIGSGVILLLLPGAWSAIAKIDIRGAYLSAINWIWTGFLNFRIPVWIVLLFIIGGIVIRKLVLSIPERAGQGPSGTATAGAAIVKKPNYFSYTKDTIRFWTFRWGYFPGEQGMPPTIANLHAVCSECDSPLIKEKPHYITRDIDGMYCAVCRKKYPLFDESQDSQEIGTIIRHRIQTNEYKGIKQTT